MSNWGHTESQFTPFPWPECFSPGSNYLFANLLLISHLISSTFSLQLPLRTALPIFCTLVPLICSPILLSTCPAHASHCSFPSWPSRLALNTPSLSLGCSFCSWHLTWLPAEGEFPFSLTAQPCMHVDYSWTWASIRSSACKPALLPETPGALRYYNQMSSMILAVQTRLS